MLKLSDDTLVILKNFSEFNPNLLFTETNVLRTAPSDLSAYVTATVAETFPKQFGIFDLKNFLAILGMFEKPQLDFTTNPEYVRIVDADDASISTNYYFADPKVVKPVKEIQGLPTPSVQFNLSEIAIKRIEKVASILSVEGLNIKSQNGQIVAVVCDPKKETKNTYTVILENEYSGKEFDLMLKIERASLKTIQGDYRVSLLGDMILKFSHCEKPVEYLFAAVAQKH